MRFSKCILPILIVTLLLSGSNTKGQEYLNELPLTKIEYSPDVIDSCGDPGISSVVNLSYSFKVIRVSESGILYCKHLPHKFHIIYSTWGFFLRLTSGGFKRENRPPKYCSIKLAGIRFNNDSLITISKLRKSLTDHEIQLITHSQPDNAVDTLLGEVYFKDYSINYSLVANGLAEFQVDKHTNSCWTKYYYEKAEAMSK